MSAEQPSPDELTAENALICEKLLGWKRFADPINGGWWGHDGIMEFEVPSFTTWADAGLILEALTEKYAEAIVTSVLPGHWLATAGMHGCDGNTGPLAIRAAALRYIRSLP